MPLFDKERKFLDAVTLELVRILKNKVMTAVMFGSVARTEEKPLSDLDICGIVEDKKDIEDVRIVLNDSSQMLYERYGIKVSPIFFTSTEFKRKINTPLIKNIIAEGKVIVGNIKRVA